MQDASSKQQTKQKYKPNHQQTGQPPHPALPIRGKTKQPEKEFRIMIVKMIKSLENRMEKTQESINKDLEELKNKHTETTQLLK